jgi:Leucine-rich repeat (LRR) protein
MMFDGCKDLEKLEIENCPKLRRIQGYGCKLDELILNKFPDLIHVCVPFNCLRKLEIKDCEEIEVLFCNNNNLKELDISELTNLKKMHCYRNMLETLDCRELRGLRELFAQENYCLKEVKLKLHPWLEQIDLAENELISLDISRCKALIQFSCRDNKLTDIDISNNVKLEDLYLSNNYFPPMDIKKFSHLEQLQKLIIGIHLPGDVIDDTKMLMLEKYHKYNA